MEVTPMKEVPIWEKSNLTLEEAAAYRYKQVEDINR